MLECRQGLLKTSVFIQSVVDLKFLITPLTIIWPNTDCVQRGGLSNTLRNDANRLNCLENTVSSRSVLHYIPYM